MNKTAFIMCMQFLLIHVSNAQLPDSLHFKCGTTPEYTIAQNNYAITKISGAPLPQGPYSYFSKQDFINASVVPEVCGHFNLYYADFVVPNPIGGFSEPGAIGNDRRATLCAVLTYIESVIDIPWQIDLIILPSYFPIGNPATIGTKFLGRAAPYFPLLLLEIK